MFTTIQIVTASAYILGFLFSVFFFIYQLRKLLRDRRDWKLYLKKLEDRAKVADEETMSKYRWNGD